jgi:cytochrome c553
MSNWAQSIASLTVVKAFLSLTAFIAYAAFAATAYAQSAPTSHPLMTMCGACHGADGNATVPGVPSLAGQPKIFIENQLVMIREGMRDVPQMKGLLDQVKDEDFTALAKIYSSLPSKPSGAKFDAEKLKRGAALSKQGLCGSCHLQDYSGQQQIPRLAQQREDFLLANMQQFRDGKAMGRDTMMTGILRGMTDAQLSDLAHYFSAAQK